MLARGCTISPSGPRPNPPNRSSPTGRLPGDHAWRRTTPTSPRPYIGPDYPIGDVDRQQDAIPRIASSMSSLCRPFDCGPSSSCDYPNRPPGSRSHTPIFIR